tara:strand:+ start:3572 stop:4594 length:1023 start_codon:yes stop_codon:yes gene_type:complete
MSRIVNNFIENNGADIINSSRKFDEFLIQAPGINNEKHISLQTTFTDLGIAYLRFTGNKVESNLANHIYLIAENLGKIPTNSPIGRIFEKDNAIDLLIKEYKSSSDLIQPILLIIRTLLFSDQPDMRIAGEKLIKCVFEYTELIVYQDRRRIDYKTEFIKWIQVFINETRKGLDVNVERLKLTPAPSINSTPEIRAFSSSKDTGLNDIGYSNSKETPSFNDNIERLKTFGIISLEDQELEIKDLIKVGKELRSHMKLDISTKAMARGWYIEEFILSNLETNNKYLPALKQCIEIIQHIDFNEELKNIDIYIIQVKTILKGSYNEQIIYGAIEFMKSYLEV